MNPCPQGYHCDGKALCHCTVEQQRKHRARISAPLLDRIDIHIEVPAVDRALLNATQQQPGERSEQVRQRVNQAYQRQLQRSDKANAQLSSGETDEACKLDSGCEKILDQAMQKLKLSARAYHRILRMSRTIADLDDSEKITPTHLSEAIGYRSLDRLLGN